MVKESIIGHHKGPIAALVVASIFLGGGVVGALQLGSSSAIQVPPVLAVTAATPLPGPGSEAIPPPAPPAAQQSTPRPSALSGAPAVVAADRPVVIFGPRPAPAYNSSSDAESPDRKMPTGDMSTAAPHTEVPMPSTRTPGPGAQPTPD